MSANGTDRMNAGGFTLVEMVAVILLLGILAVFVLPRFSPSALSGGLFRDQVASALRYAQKTATSHRRLVCASIGPGTVSLAIATSAGATSCNEPLRLSRGDSMLESDDASVTISPAPVTLYFQPDGRISADGSGSTSPGSSLSVGGLQVTIVGDTGHVR